VFDAQRAKSQLKSTLERLHKKAFSDLSSPESVAEQSSLTLETARSHKMVRYGLCHVAVRMLINLAIFGGGGVLKMITAFQILNCCV